MAQIPDRGCRPARRHGLVRSLLAFLARGDVRRRSAELFIDAPDGRQALGMTVDSSRHLLFVAGGATGQAYVYDLLIEYDPQPPFDTGSPSKAPQPIKDMHNDLVTFWRWSPTLDTKRSTRPAGGRRPHLEVPTT